MAYSSLQPVFFLLLSALIFLSITPPPISVQAQTSSTPSCASNLVPCANFINSTNPPSSCCTPLKNAIENDLQCLCAIYEDPTILKAFGINSTAAQQLAPKCGIDTSTHQCNALAPSGNPTPPASRPSNGAGEKAVWIGVSGLLGLFSIFWSICA